MNVNDISYVDVTFHHNILMYVAQGHPEECEFMNQNVFAEKGEYVTFYIEGILL